MNKRIRSAKVLLLIILFANYLYGQNSYKSSEKVIVNLCCNLDNDLYQVLVNNKIDCIRYNDPHEAIEEIAEGSGLLILADDYPFARTDIDTQFFETAAKRDVRVYIEFPSVLPNLELGENAYQALGYYGAILDRTVVASNAFGDNLPKLNILSMKDCHYIPVVSDNPHLVLARVEGYNSAVYGLPEETHPILFEHPEKKILVATTKISQFVTGRYAPTDSWRYVLDMILKWTTEEDSLPLLKWTPTVRPMFHATEELPSDAQLAAVKKGVEYYNKSKLYIHPSWPSQNDFGVDSIHSNWEQGDGTYGIGECYISKRIYYNGKQAASLNRRADCNLEAAMGLSFGVALLNDNTYLETIQKLGDYVFLKSEMCKGAPSNPESASYGLIRWDDNGSDMYWGDDNARVLVSTIVASSLTHNDRWNDFIVRGILANFRTSSKFGFRPSHLTEKKLQANGWEHYYNSEFTFFNPHMEAYPWLTYLWLYSKTGYKPLLERTKAGFKMMMDAYPDWSVEANRFEQEPSRMLLPLAWLVKVEDTPQHRSWLDKMAQYVINIQDKSGAIPQIPHTIVKTNDKYGADECAMAHGPGDPVTDALYAINFAFIGMNEAAEITGNKNYKKSADMMADFFIRTQTQSQKHEELDGTWYRGFDFKKWDYWGSDGDLGWGVWTNEIGWTHSWIVATLALREMETNLWEVASEVNISNHFENYRKSMLPD